MRTEMREELARLSRRMQGVEKLDVWPPVRHTDRQLEQFVERNARALDEARRVLAAYGERLETPVEEDEDWPLLDEVSDGMQEVRGLIRAMSYAMKSAIRAGETTAARDWALDMLLLACLIRNGGVAVESMLGLACEGFVIAGLRTIREELAATCAVETIASLQRHLNAREPLEKILERDERWGEFLDANTEKVESDNAASKQAWEESKAEVLAMDLDLPEDVRESLAECTWEDAMSAVCRDSSELATDMRRQGNRSLAQLHLLMAEIGVSAFRRRHGRLPDALEELCPEFLPAVPPDPFTGEPLIYRPADGEYLLYSTGAKGHDGGGLKLPLNDVIAGSGDLFLDTVAREEVDDWKP